VNFCQAVWVTDCTTPAGSHRPLAKAIEARQGD
jgi:hypothetical protein